MFNVTMLTPPSNLTPCVLRTMLFTMSQFFKLFGVCKTLAKARQQHCEADTLKVESDKQCRLHFLVEAILPTVKNTILNGRGAFFLKLLISLLLSSAFIKDPKPITQEAGFKTFFLRFYFFAPLSREISVFEEDRNPVKANIFKHQQFEWKACKFPIKTIDFRVFFKAATCTAVVFGLLVMLLI